MRIIFIFIIAVMSLGGHSRALAQHKIDMVEILGIQSDIAAMEERISYLIRHKPELADMKGLRQFHIIDVYPTDNPPVIEGYFTKNEYLDQSFLYHLSPSYYTLNSPWIFGKKKRYISALTFITDSTGNLLATGDVFLVHVAPVKGEDDIKLAKMFFDGEIDFAFYVSQHAGEFITYLKNDSLYAYNTRDLTIYPWREFIDRYLNTWVTYVKKETNASE